MHLADHPVPSTSPASSSSSSTSLSSGEGETNEEDKKKEENKNENKTVGDYSRGLVEVGHLHDEETGAFFNKDNYRHQTLPKQLSDSGVRTIFPEVKKEVENEKDLYNGKKLQEYILRNLKFSNQKFKLAFLMGFHQRVGGWSHVYHTFKKNPIGDKQVLRLVWEFAFD